MTNSNSKLTLKLGNMLLLSYERSEKKAADNSKLSLKTALLLLIAVAVVVILGIAAFAKDPSSFVAVTSVWSEIKPVLLLLPKLLK